MQLDPMVFVVDDDKSVREALGHVLDSMSLRFKCFGSAHEFLRYRRPDNPMCLILDIRMPGINGLELQQELVAASRPIPIIFMTAYADVPTAVEAMKAGAIEFLSKPFCDEDLGDAVRRALDQSRRSDKAHKEIASLRERHSCLSVRERQVLERLLQGRLNKQIGAELGIHEITVKVHRRHVMEKMSAATFADLVRMGERLRELWGESKR